MAAIAIRIWAREPHEIHAVSGMAALAGVDHNLVQVTGGARKLAQELLRSSGANFVQAQVNSITWLRGNKFNVAFQRVQSPSDIVYTEGANDGKARVAQDTYSEEYETYDAVIIATPLEEDKSNLKLYGFGADLSYPRG